MLSVFIGSSIGFAAYMFIMWLRSRPVKAKTKKQSSMSNPAQAIMKIYNSLPESARNLEDLEDKLRALDAELGITAVNQHLGTQQRNWDTYGWYWRLSWSACVCKDCKFRIYRDIAVQLEELRDSVKKQEEILQLANIEDIDMQSILEKIRVETEIANESREELKKSILGP